MGKSDAEDDTINQTMEDLTLLVRKEDLDITELQDFLFSHVQELDFEDEEYNSPIALAILYNHREDVLDLLLTYGLQINIIILASVADSQDVRGVKILLAHGIDPSEIQNKTSYYSCEAITKLFNEHLEIIGEV